MHMMPPVGDRAIRLEQDMHDEVSIVLNSLEKGNIVYVPNRGNAGDSFIQHATYQFFSRIGLAYEIGSQDGLYENRIIVCAGGGNLVSPYHNFVDFLNRNMGKWKRLIILPHTIRSYEDSLSWLGPDCHIFCRDYDSLAFVRRYAPSAKSSFAPDMAFACDLEQTTRQVKAQWARDLFDRTLLVRNTKRLLRTIGYGLKNPLPGNALNAFRTDIERTDMALPESNIDLSQAFSADDMSPDASLYATYWLKWFLDRFSVIRTNRLHIGIMSAMLGKQVYFYDNSYGKNRAVFLASIRDRFPNVHWQEAASC